LTVRYPTIPAGKLAEGLDDLIEGAVDDLGAEAVMFGSGPAFDDGPLNAAVDDIRSALDHRLGDSGSADLDDDQFEGAMSARLYEALSEYPVEILDDPAFWAYLAAGPLWFFVKWREDPTKRKRDGYQEYVDGRVNHACVPLRMYLRAQAVVDETDTSLPSAVTRGTDFWRSHIIRVRTGAAPDLARAVTEQQRDSRMAVGPLREYAKRINRRWSNQVIHVLESEECQKLAESERE
jgi:hypothetical protein